MRTTSAAGWFLIVVGGMWTSVGLGIPAPTYGAFFLAAGCAALGLRLLVRGGE